MSLVIRVTTDALFFSSLFGVEDAVLDEHGTFNVCMLNDLPLFIDPFLYFNSEKPEYQKIHKDMIDYLMFLKRLARKGPVSNGLKQALFMFPEIKQNWLGFSIADNKGHGLGNRFAGSIIAGFNGVLGTFGEETISSGTHLEKLCLIQSGRVSGMPSLTTRSTPTMRATARRRPANRIAALTTFDYDPVGNLTRIVDAEGDALANATEYLYDGRNLLQSETYPTGAQGRTKRAYAYDLGRRLVKRTVTATLASGFSEVTTYIYDNANRLIDRTMPTARTTISPMTWPAD